MKKILVLLIPLAICLWPNRSDGATYDYRLAFSTGADLVDSVRCSCYVANTQLATAASTVLVTSFPSANVFVTIPDTANVKIDCRWHFTGEAGYRRSSETVSGKDSPSGWDATDSAIVRAAVADTGEALDWGATGTGSGSVVPVGYLKGWIDSLFTGSDKDYHFGVSSAGGDLGVDLAAVDEYYENMSITFVSGQFKGQSTEIFHWDTDSNNMAIDTMAFDVRFSSDFALADTFYVSPMPLVDMRQWKNYRLLPGWLDAEIDGVLGVLPYANIYAVDSNEAAANNLEDCFNSSTGYYFEGSIFPWVERVDSVHNMVYNAIDTGDISKKALWQIADRTFKRVKGRITSTTMTDSAFTLSSDFDGFFDGELDDMMIYMLDGAATPYQVAVIDTFINATNLVRIKPKFTQAPGVNDSVVVVSLITETANANALGGLTPNDSGLISRIDHRVVWGTAQGTGSDSSTLAQRDVSIDSAGLLATTVYEIESNIADTGQDLNWDSVGTGGTGLDSAATSRILHRVVWGTSKSPGTDSSTLDERDVNVEAIDNKVIAARRLGWVWSVGDEQAVEGSSTPTTTRFTTSDAMIGIDNHWKDNVIVFTTGALIGQTARVIKTDGAVSHDTVWVQPPFTAPPGVGDSFLVLIDLSHLGADSLGNIQIDYEQVYYNIDTVNIDSSSLGQWFQNLICNDTCFDVGDPSGGWIDSVAFPVCDTCGGGGDGCVPGANITLRVYTIDTSGVDDTLPMVGLSLYSSTGVWSGSGISNSAGYWDFPVVAGTWRVVAGKNGFHFDDSSYVVTTNDTVAIWGYDVPITPSGDPKTASVALMVVKSDGEPFPNVLVTAQLVTSNVVDSAGHAVGNPIQTERTDVNGAAYFTCIWSSYLIPATDWRFTVHTPGSGGVTRTITIPREPVFIINLSEW